MRPYLRRHDQRHQVRRRGLVADYVAPGAHMIVMEGPKVVGDATICEVFDTDERGLER